VVLAWVTTVATTGLVPAERVAAAPVLTIDPASDLVDGQRVTFGGSGFPDGEFLLVAQCSSDVTTVFDGSCGYGGGTVDVDGNLSGQVVVRAIMGSDPTVDCRSPGACVLIAAVYDGAAEDYIELARAALPFDPDGPLAPPPTLSVTPSEGLVDGQTVEVSGSGALTDGLDIIQCTAEPAAWDDCDFDTTTFADVTDGSFSESHPVFAVIATQSSGQVDCRTAGRCALVAVGDASRWADTAVVPLGFAPDGPLLPPPTLTVTPADGLVDGQAVQIIGTGFRSRFLGDAVQIHQCAPDPAPERCRTSFDRYVPLDEQGGFTVTMPVTARMPTSEGLHDCRAGADRCSLVATTSGIDSARAGRAELSFDPDAPLLPDPGIAVEPATDLGDFTPVAISGSNFTPGSTVTVEVCRTGATGDGCDGTNGESPPADEDGAIATEIAVFADPTGEGGVPGELDCRQAPGCEVVATDDVRGVSARRPLTFGPPDAPRGRYRDRVFTDIDVTRDVAYRQTTDDQGNPIELELDIYRPAGDTATERPVIVWMYGGWFAFGDKLDDYIVDFATESARRGYVGVAINYRERSNTTSDPVQLIAAILDAYDDAIAAVEWLQAHAGEYGIDPDAIAASGWSAGAVTSVNLAYMPGDRGPATSPIAAALPVAGVVLSSVDPGEPPSLVFRGTDDTVLPPGTNNTDTVCPQAQAHGIACELVDYDGAGHEIVGRSRDIMRRGTDFLGDEVLDQLGYFDVTADAGGPYTVDEGSTVTLDGSGSSGEAGAGLSYAWSPGARVDAPTSSSPVLRGVDDGTETLTLDVTNAHGIAASATAEVVTRNVAPTIDTARTDTTAGRRAVSLTATISDPGAADTHTATVAWGDGHTETVTVTPSNGRASVSARHDYATAGRYPVVLTVEDDDGGSATWTQTVTTGCTVNGTSRADVLIGTGRADTICGLGGNDILFGMAGNDVLLGGPGHDLLVGGPGDDVLDGEAGWDLLIGGPGTNTCTGEIRLSCPTRPR
jgi:acetyl esterase/lipase